MKHRGLAQIPLMIGLLLMAVALPVATKLVQDNQDNRNKAMEVEDCVRDTDCGSGYRCKSGMCVKNAPTLVPTSGYCNVALIDTSDCGGGDCDNDEVEQTWRTANCGTNKVCVAKDSCKTSVCSNGQYKCVGTKSVACLNGQFNGATQECGTLGCNASTNKCNVAPTATAVPTSPSVYGKQGDLCTSTVTSGMRLPNCSTYCLNGKFYYVLAEGTYRCGVNPTPTVSNCYSNGKICGDFISPCSKCCNGSYSYYNVGDIENLVTKCGPDPAKVSPTPTVRPTAQQCRTNNVFCDFDTDCCTGNCGDAGGIGVSVCKCVENGGTTTRNVITDCCSGKGTLYDNGRRFLCTALPTPTSSCISNGTPCNVGLGPRCTKCCNGSYGYFNEGDIQNLVYKCGPDPAKVTPTAKPTTSSCADVGQSCTTRSCCTGKGLECTDEGGLSYPICVKSGSIPTLKPTIKPTMTTRPTSIPCAGTGQACSTRSCCTTANVCTDEGLSYPICVPRNNIPTYIPVPTIKCAKSGSSCTTLPCCEAYLDVCTDEGLSYPKCVPRSQVPTYIPIPTMMPCAKSGSTCSSTLGCCSMSEKCTNGKCVAIAGPSVSPTGVPYITSVPGKCPNSDPCTLPITIEKCAEQCCGTGYYYYNSEHKKYYCGSEPDPTRVVNPTNPPSGACTQCSGKPEAKGKGDADCSGTTDINDASIWRSEFTSGQLGTEVSNSWRADFDCDGKVTLNDISIWRENFIKGLTN